MDPPDRLLTESVSEVVFCVVFACVVVFLLEPESPHPCANAKIRHVAESEIVRAWNVAMSFSRSYLVSFKWSSTRYRLGRSRCQIFSIPRPYRNNGDPDRSGSPPSHLASPVITRAHHGDSRGPIHPVIRSGFPQRAMELHFVPGMHIRMTFRSHCRRTSEHPGHPIPVHRSCRMNRSGTRNRD